MMLLIGNSTLEWLTEDLPLMLNLKNNRSRCVDVLLLAEVPTVCAILRQTSAAFPGTTAVDDHDVEKLIVVARVVVETAI